MKEKETPQVPLNGEHRETETTPKDLRITAALVRTVFSSEQTLMSWIRTALSLFTFGFSIAQFFHYLDKRQDNIQLAAGPRRLGIALICVGILVLMLAMVEHVLRLRKMKKQGLPANSASFLPIGSAIALLMIGLTALIGTTLNWHL